MASVGSACGSGRADVPPGGGGEDGSGVARGVPHGGHPLRGEKHTVGPLGMASVGSGACGGGRADALPGGGAMSSLDKEAPIFTPGALEHAGRDEVDSGAMASIIEEVAARAEAPGCALREGHEEEVVGRKQYCGFEVGTRVTIVGLAAR